MKNDGEEKETSFMERTVFQSLENKLFYNVMSNLFLICIAFSKREHDRLTYVHFLYNHSDPIVFFRMRHRTTRGVTVGSLSRLNLFLSLSHDERISRSVS